MAHCRKNIHVWVKLKLELESKRFPTYVKLSFWAFEIVCEIVYFWKKDGEAEKNRNLNWAEPYF